jgi:hypothetical protein
VNCRTEDVVALNRAAVHHFAANRATRKIDTFPTAHLPSFSGGLPVEVVLIAQIGVGAGSPLIAVAAVLQRGHGSYVDALDEPSARIGGTDFERGDVSSLYSFVVGAQGHPFHRHEGHRVFTAISGSGGALLRFSTASMAQIERDPRAFVDALRHVEIPPDCLFTVRFGGGTWHQFLPLDREVGHPALFALSCHTNELGGDLAPEQRERVLADAADIPTLTEVLPEQVDVLLAAVDRRSIPTIALSLTAATTSIQGRFCAKTRHAAACAAFWRVGAVRSDSSSKRVDTRCRRWTHRRRNRCCGSSSRIVSIIRTPSCWRFRPPNCPRPRPACCRPRCSKVFCAIVPSACRG